MSTYSADILEAFSDNASFQAWSLSTHLLMLGAGWVQTADSGQVDVTTAALPATSAFSGFRIYRFNDTNQNTAPIYCKLEFGVASTATRPSLRVQFGTGTNGAGTLVNPNTQQTINQSITGAAGVSRPAYGSTLDGVNAMVAGYVATADSQRLGFTVERWRNSDGTPNALGWSVLIYGTTAIYEQSYRVGTGWRTVRAFMPVPQPAHGSGVEGTDIGVFPWIPMYAIARPYGLGMVAYYNADITAGTVFSITRYGVARSYRALGSGNIVWGNNGVTLAPAILFS